MVGNKSDLTSNREISREEAYEIKEKNDLFEFLTLSRELLWRKL